MKPTGKWDKNQGNGLHDVYTLSSLKTGRFSPHIFSTICSGPAYGKNTTHDLGDIEKEFLKIKEICL